MRLWPRHCASVKKQVLWAIVHSFSRGIPKSSSLASLKLSVVADFHVSMIIDFAIFSFVFVFVFLGVHVACARVCMLRYAPGLDMKLVFDAMGVSSGNSFCWETEVPLVLQGVLISPLRSDQILKPTHAVYSSSHCKIPQ